MNMYIEKDSTYTKERENGKSLSPVNLEIFRDNFILANSVKRHICDV